MRETLEKIREVKALFTGKDRALASGLIRRYREETCARKKQNEIAEQTISIMKRKNGMLERELADLERRRQAASGHCNVAENSMFQKAKAISETEDEVISLEAHLSDLGKTKGALEKELEEKKRVNPVHLLLGIYQGIGVDIYSPHAHAHAHAPVNPNLSVPANNSVGSIASAGDYLCKVTNASKDKTQILKLDPAVDPLEYADRIWGLLALPSGRTSC